MVNNGTKVVLKSNGKAGYIKSSWNANNINPKVFSINSPIGYNVSTNDGVDHICLEEDFSIIN